MLGGHTVKRGEMSISDRDLIAYCGQGIRHEAKAADVAEELGAELDKMKLPEYAQGKAASAQELRPFKEFLSLLKATSSLRGERPCRLGGRVRAALPNQDVRPLKKYSRMLGVY